MIYLIYWYGSKSDSEFYGFVSKANFVSYDREQAKGPKGIHALPSRIQNKIDISMKLLPKEEDILRTYQEMNEDLLKEPCDRRRGIIHYQEGYEMLSAEDLKEIDVNESSSSDDDSDGNDSRHDSSDNREIVSKKVTGLDEKDDSKKNDECSKLSKKNVKVTKPSASLDHNRNATNDILGDLDHEIPVPSFPKKLKKKRGRPKRNDDSDNDATRTATKKAKKEVANPAVSSDADALKSAIDSAAVLSDDIGDDDEESSGDDESSADVKDADDDNEVDDDHNDLDFVEKKASRKPKANQTKKNVSVIKKAQKIKPKIEAPKTDRQLKRKETEAFIKCEELYTRLIRKWEAAIRSENVERLRRILTEADAVVDNFCYSFMLSYDLSTICKNSKKVLKNANEDLSQFSALKERIKTTFEAKQSLVPKGFMPKRSQVGTIVASSDLDISEHSKVAKGITVPRRPVDTSAKALSQSSMDMTGTVSLKNNNPMIAGEAVAEGSTRLTVNPQPKTERKKFLLGSLIQQRPPSSQGNAHEDSSTKVPSVSSAKPIVPSWVTGPPLVDAPINYPRSLALDFLLQMADQLSDKTVNVDSFARSIEVSVFNWATKGLAATSDDTDWTTRYWAKIHALVAAFCGKLEKGTFQTLVLQGRFDTPDKLVALSDDKYVASFEGKTVQI
jgi:hypothetical protein